MPVERASEVIAGYTITNDVSVRDWQLRTPTMTMGTSTAQMIYNCCQQVAHLSQAFTLAPGDVIATGAPAGIGAVLQTFPEGLLEGGDVVRVEIDGIGELRNIVVEEPDGFVVPEGEEVPQRAH